jgi:hypothetical protein
MTRQWRTAPGERRSLFRPVGLRLVDLLTGGQPIGRLRAEVDVLAAGAWLPAGKPVVLTPAAIVTVPDLERTAHPGPGVPRRYRLRVSADFYRPLYQVLVDGIEFDAFPYNDDVAPLSYARAATEAYLLPSASYPFPPHVRVLHGAVVDTAGAPVEDAIVVDPGSERAATDARGAFALPLRTALNGTPIAISASHPRSGRTGSVQVTLPADLGRSQLIQVS